MKNVIALAILCVITGTAYAQNADKPAKERPSPEAMFRKLDLDGDGRISKEEASKSERKRLVEKFDQIDADKDTFLSKDELIAFRRQMREQRGK